ncbi:hypothetical protein EV361DRAFT_931361 [Lentinula raphanica]|nr:hypothetical protein EV361DRAFT_931361 [Lentinula raphanica]
MTRRTSLYPSLSERETLSKAHYATIDSVLKDLKLHSRRMSMITTALADETQILDRLHYKNKNQHRSSLCSRRVSELRKYSHRVEDFQICGLVNDIRQCFFGKTNGSQQKQMKGAWTYHPDEQYILKAKEQTSSFLNLLRKMHTISSETFKSISLAMQTGAFIHLFLTLIAITSKIDTIVVELIEILQPVMSTLGRLLAIFKPDINVLKEIPDSPRASDTGLNNILRPTLISSHTSNMHEEMLPQPTTLSRKIVDVRSKAQTSTGGQSLLRKKRAKNEIDAIFGF